MYIQIDDAGYSEAYREEFGNEFGIITKGGASGFGLGLNYVLHVLDAHHGMVTVDSELGKYTEFTIFLPDQDASNGGGEEEGLDGLYQ